jgi:general secretion pathway protein H
VRSLVVGLPGLRVVSRAARQARGFTLIELLVVLVVVGVVVASIQLNLFSDDARRLRNEGERLAALLTALADESVTSGMPLAVSFGDDGYAFWERPIANAFGESAAPVTQDDWQVRPGDELFSSRRMPEGMRIAEVRVRQRILSRSEKNPERLAFSPSGVHQPFSVLLALDDLRVQVISDALGNLRVVDDADEDAD